jgi:hypothetical protein
LVARRSDCPARRISTDDPAPEISDFGIGRIAPDFDQRLVPAGIVKTKRDETTNALLAHVREVHRRAGWVLRGHPLMLPVERPPRFVRHHPCEVLWIFRMRSRTGDGIRATKSRRLMTERLAKAAPPRMNLSGVLSSGQRGSYPHTALH